MNFSNRIEVAVGCIVRKLKELNKKQNLKSIDSGGPINKHFKVRFLNEYQKVFEQKF